MRESERERERLILTYVHMYLVCSSKEALNHAKESAAQNSAVMDSPPLSQNSSETTSSNESISTKKTVAGKLISSPKCKPLPVPPYITIQECSYLS